MKAQYFLGLDIGSVSIKCVLIDETQQILSDNYTRTEGQPLVKLRQMLGELQQRYHESRPYEVEPGTTDFAYKIACNHLCCGLERGEIIRGIEYALAVFEGLDIDRSASKKSVWPYSI